MAILDLFVSVFEADTKKLEDGYNKAEKSAEDLRKEMADIEKQSQETTAKLTAFAKGAAGFLATAVSVSKLIGTSMSQADHINQLGDTAEAINANVSELDAFQKAMADSAVSGQEAQSALTSAFNAASAAAQDMGSSQAQAFRHAGIEIRDTEGKIKDGVTLMKEMADSARSLDDATAKNLFERMGVSDPKMQRELMKGREALESQMKTHKEAGVITKEQLEMSRKYREAQTALSNSLGRGAQTIMTALLPAITWTVEKLTALVDWSIKNKAFVVGFFGAIAVAVATLYVPAMISAAVATLAATWPIIAIAAAIAAVSAVIALIIDDIWNWIEGNDSLLGQLIDEFPIIGDIIDAISAVVKTLIGWFATMGEIAGDAFGWIIEKAGNFVGAWWDMVKRIVGFYVDAFTFIKDFVAGIIGWVFDKINAVSGAVSKVAGFFGFGGKKEKAEKDEADVADITRKVTTEYEDGVADVADIGNGYAAEMDEVAKNINIGSDMLEEANASPLNTMTSNTINNSTRSASENNVSIGELKIETQATDAEGIAGSARSELAEQLKNLEAETNSGVER